MHAATQHDVIILGGGLAGLSLAIQLKQRHAELDILVLERRAHPVRAAAHKVGESTVEIGAHYFANVLGLKDHLRTEQLRKFGFRFFFSEGREDIDAVTELGASRYLGTPAYQLDRGVFENFLGQHALALGVDFRAAATLRRFELGAGDAAHNVQFEREGERYSAGARWLIDAAGRASILKRGLNLAQDNAHNANAVWFRLQGRIDVNEWSNNAEWLARCNPPDRWLSTSHLIGAGYWVWLIPLSSGAHSVGIVCDADMHPMETMNTFDKALDWIRRYQPRLAREIEPRRDGLMDFGFFRNFSYGCKQVFSERRYALTGEAGLFLDPFYSPGSDFIAISNTYICELIARDRAGKELMPYLGIYEQIYFSFYESTLALYQSQYPLFGDTESMPIKVIWDYTYYWGVLCQLFFHDRLTDLNLLSRLREPLAEAMALNLAMQALFRDWCKLSRGANPAQMLDQASVAWFADLNRDLAGPADDQQVRLRLELGFQRLRSLAAEVVARATAAHPGLAVAPMLAALPPADSQNLPDHWYPRAA